MNTAAAVSAATLSLADLPAIGAKWPGQGGVFAGLVRGENGAKDYLLILGPEYDGETDWSTAMKWAAGIQSVDADPDAAHHGDYSLPTRSEQAVLLGNLRDLFQRDWYWSNTQHAEGAVYAWFQDFGDGYQYSDRKGIKLRARAVRRLPI